MESDLSYRVIGCAMRVHGALGCGFLEKVYFNALAVELDLSGIAFRKEAGFQIRYRDVIVGRYFADIVIGNDLLLEIKSIKSLDSTCESQLLNYLNASGIRTGLLFNFGSRSLQIKRMSTA